MLDFFFGNACSGRVSTNCERGLACQAERIAVSVSCRSLEGELVSSACMCMGLRCSIARHAALVSRVEAKRIPAVIFRAYILIGAQPKLQWQEK